MRLNQHKKNAIVAAIFQDVPLPKDEAVKEAVQKAFVDAMSPLCRKLYKQNPKALASAHHYDILQRQLLHVVVGDANEEEVLKPWVEAKERYDQAKSALRSLINSCSTMRQLKERLPEFAHYFEEQQTSTPNLPAVANFVTMMMNLGWTGPTK